MEIDSPMDGEVCVFGIILAKGHEYYGYYSFTGLEDLKYYETKVAEKYKEIFGEIAKDIGVFSFARFS